MRRSYREVIFGGGCAVLLGMALLAAAGCDDNDDHPPAKTATPAPSPTPTVEPCPLPPPFCGGEFPLNTTDPTQYGPAWADVVVQPSDFVPCFGPYALCYYAECAKGPDGRVSNCPCFDWFGTSYVLINGILNLDLYEATVSQCTSDPSSCQVPNGAPVCAAINNGTFLSGAERISTFSFYRAKEEPIGSQDCTDEPGLYSGCMTGPCFGPVTKDPENGTFNIHCDCPNYDGPFQIGKSGLTCDVLPQTWSAAYHVNQVPSNPCDMVSGCVPDAPEDSCGCPLFQSSTTLPPNSGVNCDTVCQEYASCQKDSVQLGYTCDATLCTSTDHDIVFAACGGLQQCDLSEIFKAEQAAQCSCCASQLCNCQPNAATNVAVYEANAAQRDAGETPQCDINDTLCGSPPP